MTASRLQVAASEFELAPNPGTEADLRTGAKACDVVGPLKTTVLLLDDGSTRVCLITTHFGPSTPVNVSELFRRSIADELGLPTSHVLFMSSHNHCSVAFAGNGVLMYESYSRDNIPPAELLPIGAQFLQMLRTHARQLAERLQPATVWWSEAHEDRITYNRKGRRSDGTTYLMREEDRLLLGEDFAGDIDPKAPVIVFRDMANHPIAALIQFTGHPVTSYHPERMIIFGEWPQIACDVLAEHLQAEPALSAPATRPANVPVGFMQGCAGNVNSRQMLSGDVGRSTEFGQMLGDRCIAALKQLKRSEREGLDCVVEPIGLPLGPLPPRQTLADEITEMDDFIRRARSGDEDTLSCAGLNFARALSPPFRARLVELVRPWTAWALDLYEAGADTSVEKQLEMDVSVLRIGDVGIVGMPCEPFQEIGLRIREDSPLPISIPCGYTNVSHGYIPDSANLGDAEYMSSHHRYTRFRPPLAAPAGDVLADAALRILKDFAGNT
ncbi:MAG: hypothetical protein RIK87_00570 [Fuerstiella sp.]